jgi:hypothetical protein
MSLFKRKSFPPVESLPAEPEFALAQGADPEGGEFVVRRNVSLEPIAGHPDYSDRVGIAIPRQGDDLSTLTEIENELEKVLERNHESLLALVVTADTFQEFVYYTRNPGAVEENRDAVAAKFPDYDLQSYVERDPKWAAYREFGGE